MNSDIYSFPFHLASYHQDDVGYKSINNTILLAYWTTIINFIANVI